ncbi:MAG TPA: SurA N-terminal domain-containing protein [Solirubrobacterales bacterium]|nr:SurA N-terminal domain-containing protein [Solirubrobacterales bacterium]
MGAKAGQRGKPERDRAAGRQRLGLILFGALFVLLFIGFAVAQGIGSPGVPSGDVAKVEDVPAEFATVSQKEFDHAMEQQVAQAKLKKAPAPGSKKSEELKEAALGELLDQIWIRGQAEELGITVTDKQVEEELAQIKKQSFPSKGAFEKFLKESKFTEEDVNDRVELQVLSTAIQEQVNGEAPAPSQSQVADYYEAEKATQFTEKESRDVRLIINKDKAKVEAAKKELEKDNSPASWKKVAPKYSSDPTSKSKGGLQEGITEEFLKGELKEAIFGSATGELKGPVKFETNWILVEVAKLKPAKVKSLAEVKAQIEETLKGEKQQEFFAEFVSDYQTKWQTRTQCADGYVIERCANFTGSGRPANAAPACYEADPKTPATECPAPVTPISPALPGTVTPQQPKGEPFPQRPQPESAGEETGTEVPAGAVPPAEGGAEAPPAETGE